MCWPGSQFSLDRKNPNKGAQAENSETRTADSWLCWRFPNKVMEQRTMQNEQNNTTLDQTQSKITVRLVSFDIDVEGRVVEHPLSKHERNSLDATLLTHLYPDIKVAIANVPLGFLDPFEESRVTTAMTCIQFQGVTYKLVGGSGSTKEGKFYLVDEAHHDFIARRFRKWAEAAIVYFGILVSPCKKIIALPNARVLVVPDRLLGTNDCRGWLAERVFAQFALEPYRMYQFRLAFGDSGEATDVMRPEQAKGCFKVMSTDAADILGVDMIIPVSSVKPEISIPEGLEKRFQREGRIFTAPAILGIREQSEVREFRSSYQLTQYAPQPSIEREFIPETLNKEVRKLTAALQENDHKGLLQLLGIKEPDEITEDDELRAVEAVLLADGEGQISRFPYIANQLNKVLAKWAYKACTGGGIRLPGFTLTDDGFLYDHEGTIYAGSDWIPLNRAVVATESKRSLCVRYPIRGEQDLLPVEHLSTFELRGSLVAELAKQGCDQAMEIADRIAAQQLNLIGAYILHSETAKQNGGDFDFDYVCAVEEDRFPLFIEHRFSLGDAVVHQEKNKKKAKSPWRDLPRVAMAARGNQIGRITDTITSCIAAGKKEFADKLIVQLQNALDALKWNVRPNREIIDEIGRLVPQASWLALKRTQAVTKLPMLLDVDQSDRIGNLYNQIRSAIPDLNSLKAPIAEFKLLVSGKPFTREMFDECKFVNAVYAALVGRTSERQDRLNFAYEQASAEVEEVRNDSNRSLVRQKYEAKRKAFVAKRDGEEKTKREFRAFNTWLALWASGKEEDRRSWLQAMLTVACSGNGTGAILFHTFLQELVEALAGETGGLATRVAQPELEGKSFYTDSEARTFLVEATDTGKRQTLLFKKSKSGEPLLGLFD